MSNNLTNELDNNNREKKIRLFGRIFIFVFVLLVGELLFRIVFPLPEVSNFNRTAYSPFTWRLDPEKRPQLSNASYSIISDPDGVSFVNTLNLYGFRCKNWKLKKNSLRVMFIGDSFMEGDMASDDETIPVGFKKSAEKDDLDLEVMNMGIDGASPIHYLLLLRDAIPLFRPDYVIVGIFQNDFPTPPYNPEGLRNPLVPQFNSYFVPRVIPVFQRLLKGQTMIFRWIRPPFRFFRPVPDKINPWTRGDADLSKFVKPKIAKPMREGRFNPYIPDLINRTHRGLNGPIYPEAFLEAMKRCAERHGTRMFLVYIPGRLQVSDYYIPFAYTYAKDLGIKSLKSPLFRLHTQILAKTAESLSLPFLNLLPVVEEKEQQGIRCYWDYDPHMRGENYLFLGKTIYYWWKEKTQKSN